MSAAKIRKGDKVVVLSGRDKGKTGEITAAMPKDGKVVVTQGFGVRKLGDPTPVDGKTIFEIASNSKAFTAAGLAMLVDQGKLEWDDPVIKHLPDFRMYDAYVTAEMTVRDLLTHRSGRLGPAIWAHVGFNATTVVALLLAR